MRATIQNYVQAERERREENDEKGFSLIELIIVVVILGILAAIAIPVFMGLQGQAEQSALESTTANAASQAASDLAQGKSPSFTKLISASDLTELKLEIAAAGDDGTEVAVDNFCVTGTATGLDDATAGPGC